MHLASLPLSICFCLPSLKVMGSHHTGTHTHTHAGAKRKRTSTSSCHICKLLIRHAAGCARWYCLCACVCVRLRVCACPAPLRVCVFTLMLHACSGQAQCLKMQHSFLSLLTGVQAGETNLKDWQNFPQLLSFSWGHWLYYNGWVSLPPQECRGGCWGKSIDDSQKIRPDWTS